MNKNTLETRNKSYSQVHVCVRDGGGRGVIKRESEHSLLTYMMARGGLEGRYGGGRAVRVGGGGA